MNTTEKTVREIAIENPAGVRVFEMLGIDYCCGGQRTLTDACVSAKVSLERVQELLDRGREPAPESAAWVDAPLGELIAHIVQEHHGFVRREMPRLMSLSAKVVSKHGDTRHETRQIAELFNAVSQELSTHMLKEEQILFPHIERMDTARRSGKPAPPAFFGPVQRPISNTVADHADAGALLSRMRELSKGYAPPQDACPTYRALEQGLEQLQRDLHRHVHLENNIR